MTFIDMAEATRICPPQSPIDSSIGAATLCLSRFSRFCLVAEPIHESGFALLRAHGFEVQLAPTADLTRCPELLRRADAIVVRNALPAQAIDAAPRLALVANHGTGYDAVDIAHAHALGIAVTFTPTANVQAVAEHAVMLMLATARQVVLADGAARAGDTRFKFEQRMHSMQGKTLGVVGFGHTAQRVVAIALGLCMRVVVWSARGADERIRACGAQPVADLATLLGQADVVSLHQALDSGNHHLLNADTLALCKPGAIVVNTARGGLIDEAALVDALRSGRIFGAGLDVQQAEPIPASSPLIGMRGVVLTPHVAGSTEEALRECALQCAQHIVDFFAGQKPAHLVDPGVWPRRRFLEPKS